MPVETLVEHDYDGVRRPVGTIYDADAPDADVLVLLGRVRRVPRRKHA